MNPRCTARWMRLAVFHTVALLLWACGGDDGGDGREVDPSQVRHSDLARGFWMAVADDGTRAPFDQEILQFTTVNEARALYGELGVIHGTGGSLLQTLDQSLEWFSGDDRILLTFSRSSPGRIHIVAGTRVSGGNVGLSRLGFVGFDYGFAPPVERRIHRFVRGEELVIAHEHDDELTFRYRWVPDCRWDEGSGWSAARAVVDGTYNPWFSIGLTRAGDLIGAFHPEVKDRLQSMVWAEGACPVFSRELSVPMRAGAHFVPDGEDGLVGVRRTASGLGTVHVRPGQPLVQSEEGPAAEQTPVEQLRRLPDGRVVFLETDLRLDRSQQSAERWVAEPGRMATRWELPPLPSFDDDLHVRLRADGVAFITWRERIQEVGRQSRLRLEQPMGTWEDLSLEAQTADGVTIRLDQSGTLGPLEVDVDGRIVALVPAVGLIPSLHQARPLPEGARALVRMADGQAEARLLPAGSGGRTYRAHVDAAGTWRGFGEFGASDSPDTELEVITWPVGGEVSVLRPGLATRPNQRGLHGFWDHGWYLGTYIWHRWHVHVEDNGGILLTDGWSRAFVRPPDALFRGREVTVTLALENAPPGAGLEALHEPFVACEETCDVTVPQGTVLGLQVVSPPGWVVDGPWECRTAYTDAGLCSVVVKPGWTCPEGHVGEPDEEVCEAGETYRFRWRRTAAVELTDARVPGWWGSVVADAEGEILAIVNTVSGVLPDGTEVSGGDNANPIPVLTRWQGTSMRWATPLPQHVQVDWMGFADNGDVHLVLVAPDRRTLSLPEIEGGEAVPFRSGERAVARFAAADGRLLAAPRMEMPLYLNARAHTLMPDGTLLTFGRTGRPSGPGVDPDATVVPLDHELLLRHAPEGQVEILYERPETRGGGSAMFAVHPSGGLLFLRLLDGTIHWQAFDADLQAHAGEGQSLDIGSILFADLRVTAAGDGYLLGVGGGSMPPDGSAPAVGDGSELLVLELDAAGRRTRALALPNGAGTVLGLARLPDGRVAASVRRGTAGGVESLLLEGQETLELGSFSTQVNAQEGFLSAGLAARPDGTLVWVSRPWEQVMVVRPFLLYSPFLMQLDPDEWAAMPDVMPSHRAYLPR